MPLPEEVLQRYVSETAAVTLSDASSARLVRACATAGQALQALAADSLFDTEPEHLHSTLEALAGDESQ